MGRLLAVLILAFSALASGCVPLVVGTAAVGGTMVAGDRRSAEVQLTDERIEWTASKGIGPKIGAEGHVNIASYNRTVLLTGETKTEALKEECEKLAAGASDVKNVVNEIQIAAPSSLSSRSNDTYLTGAVKARFVGEQKFNPLYVKVVTESGVVYLMGLVTKKEADDATNIARHVSGVKRVVRIFEYIPDPPPKPASEPPARPASDGIT
jgi:osmotically-inducible protein OsmY